MNAVATKEMTSDSDRKVISYEIDQLDLENNQVVVILDKMIISIVGNVLQRANWPDGRPHKATRSLGARLAKICYIFQGVEPASSCLDIANEIYDFDGRCLKAASEETT